MTAHAAAPPSGAEEKEREKRKKDVFVRHPWLDEWSKLLRTKALFAAAQYPAAGLTTRLHKKTRKKEKGKKRKKKCILCPFLSSCCSSPILCNRRRDGLDRRKNGVAKDRGRGRERRDPSLPQLGNKLSLPSAFLVFLRAQATQFEKMWGYSWSYRERGGREKEKRSRSFLPSTHGLALVR